MIEARRHLLVGAKALTAYMEQRFTKDTDYVVGRRDFARIRKWFREQGIAHEDRGEVIQSEALAIDVIDGHFHPVLKEILKQESGLPSAEALAATKYVAFVSDTREQRKKYQHIADFAGLVTLDGFDVNKFLAFLVDRHAEQRGQARELIDRIRRNEFPITI